MKTLVITLAVMLSGGVWSLPDCIQYALEHNITVKQSSVEVQQREVELSTAKAGFLPAVSASASENFSFGRSITADNTYANTNVNTTSMSLGAQMPIFDGLGVYNGIRMGKLNLQAATAALEKAKDDIRVAVAQAYVQILYCKAMLSVAKYQVETDSLQLASKQARMLSGMASKADVLAIQATLAKSRLEMTKASNSLNLAILDLTQLLEIGTPEGFEIVSPNQEALNIKVLPSPDEIYAEAVSHKAVVRTEEIKLDYAKVAVAKAKGGYLPTLNLQGGIGTNYYGNSNAALPVASFNEQLRNNFSQFVGLTLNIPVFSRLSTRNSVRSAKLSMTIQQLRLENVKKVLFKEIQQAFYNAVASQCEYESSRQAAESAENSYLLVKEKYENGKSPITEYNEAKSRWMGAQEQLLQSTYRCLFETALLDFYRGREIIL